MTFVVVWLNEAGKRVIVEEVWVQNLNCARLKNNGRNSNQDFLIFWSSKDDVPNFDVQARFSAPLNDEYLSSCDGVCYFGRIEKFFGMYFLLFFNTVESFYLKFVDEYADALDFIKHTRRQMPPPVYNPARVREKPFPNTEQPIEHDLNDSYATADEGNQFDHSNDLNTTAENSRHEIECNDLNESDADEENFDDCDNEFDQLNNLTGDSANLTETESSLLEPTNVDESHDGNANNSTYDSAHLAEAERISLEPPNANVSHDEGNASNSSNGAQSSFCHDEQSSDEQNDEDLLALGVKQEGSVHLNDVDEQELENILNQENDDGDEANSFIQFEEDLYIQSDKVPKPITGAVFWVKRGDLLCGKVPFKEYVS